MVSGADDVAGPVRCENGCISSIHKGSEGTVSHGILHRIRILGRLACGIHEKIASVSLHHERRLEVARRGDIVHRTFESGHVGRQFHGPATSIHPIEAGTPVEVSLAVIVHKGLGIDHMKTGFVICGNQRLVAEHVAPGAERLVRSANPHLAAHRDVHVEPAVAPFDHGWSPNLRLGRSWAAARRLGRPAKDPISPVLEVRRLPATQRIAAPRVESGVNIDPVVFLQDAGIGIIAGQDGVGRMRNVAGNVGCYGNCHHVRGSVMARSSRLDSCDADVTLFLQRRPGKRLFWSVS